MLQLDKNRSHGTVHPPRAEPHCDRQVHYEQDGAMFDQHGRQIVPGVPLVTHPNPISQAAAAYEREHGAPAGLDQMGQAQAGRLTQSETAVEEPGDPNEPMTVGMLLELSSTMPWSGFLKQAKKVLGPECPTSKEAIVDALHKAVKKHAERASKKPSGKAETIVMPAETGKFASKPGQPTASAQAPAPKGKVDLAAWARGQKEYLWPDVQKAIRIEHNRMISGPEARKDAVDFIVDVGLVPVSEARRDV